MVKKTDNIVLNVEEIAGTGIKEVLKEANSKMGKAKKEIKLDMIPIVGNTQISIPPFFATPTKKGWKLVNPLTDRRTLSTRKKMKSIDIVRDNVEDIEVSEIGSTGPPPTIGDFSKKDAQKLFKYFLDFRNGVEGRYPTENKPRGFPATLYKNAKKAGLKETKEKVYTKNKLKPKAQSAAAAKETAKMEAEDTAGQKLREEEEKAKAKEAVARFKAKVAAKLEEDKKNKERAKVLKSMDRIIAKEEKAKAAKAAKTTGGELPKGLNPLEIIPKGLKAVKDKVVDIAQKVIKGRDGYSPSVTTIINKFADQEVESIELHRRVLPAVYTGLLNVLTLGEFNKRIKDQPKDKLFHISMWIKLKNGKTILVEKNEVINMKVNPKKEKEEEVQPAGAVPAGLKFGEMLDKTQKEMGSKYFTYSARDNNCGNYIEAVLKANGMNTKETNDFIGQDAKAILKGYPRIAKTLNAITDIAGRANVVMEGGGMEESDCDCESECECECECDDKEMNGEGLMSGRGFHVATMTNKFHRIPQSETQIKSYFQGSGMCYECKGMKGTGTTFGRPRVEPEETPELPPYETEQERIEREALQTRLLAQAEVRPAAEAEARQVAEENRRAAKEARRKAREDRRIAAGREEYIYNFKNNLLTQKDIDKLTEMGRRSATTREDQIRFVFKITKPKIMKDKTLSEMEKEILMRYVFDVVDNLTDEEIIIREVPNAVSIPYYSINDIREASVVPSKISKAVPINNITNPTETLPGSTATLIPNTPHSFLPPDTPYISGFGLKKPKFVKGSQEAKDYMAMLREKRNKK